MTALILFALLAVANATPLSTNHLNNVQRPRFAQAPILDAHHPYGTINNSYIVLFKDDVAPSLMRNHFNFLQMAHEADPIVSDDGLVSGIRHVYTHVGGYAGVFSENVLNKIRSMPEVDFIERDQIVTTLEMQKSAPWGLARISHRPKLTFSTFTKYEYDVKGGTGVDVYVIDTGINIRHDEFEGRATWGVTIPQNDVDDDGNGHGTHCAGTIASRLYGVAKNANLIAVKVLGSNGSGTMTDVIGGVDWATARAVEKAEAAKAEYAATGKTSHKGSVANLSLGGGKSDILNKALNEAVKKGMHTSVAAGNDDRDACEYSPASAESPITVGASTLGDEKAYFSNHGKCVDIFAPGLNIKSTYIGSSSAIATLSGTSMASPHTAGLLAYLLSIYPSETFHPDIPEDMVPPFLDQGTQYTLNAMSTISSALRAVLPRWVSGLLPLPEPFAPIPKPLPTLTPLQLKRSLIALGTSGVLKDLPPQTVNVLIFNNATLA